MLRRLQIIFKSLWRNPAAPLIVSLQIGIALAALVNVSYVVWQRYSTITHPTGIDEQNLFLVSIKSYAPNESWDAIVQTDLTYLNSFPGVRGSALFQLAPQTGNGMILPFVSRPDQKGPGAPAFVYFTTAKFIDALGLTLTSGRTFDQNAVLPPATNPNESLGKWGPEIVITRPLAEALFPGEDAVGKTVFAQIVNRPSVVVGVVESMQATPLEGPTAFFSEQVVFVSSTPPAPSGVYLVRTSPNSRDQVMARVNADLEKQQPGRLVEYVQSFSDTVDMVRAPVRASVFILVAISLLVIGVVGVGIAGLAAFEVEARIRQLGIRRALGANRSQLFTEVLFEYWLVSALGTVFGCILGASLSHKLQTNFPGLDPPFMYFVYGIAVAWCLCLIGVLLPARRAMLVSPATATRIP